MEFYRSIYSYYDDIFPLRQEQVEWVEANCATTPAKIIDIGCATGNLALALAKQGHQVNAFDLDEGMVRLAMAKSKAGNPQFRKANMLNIHKNYRKEFFDRALCFGNTLVHLNSEELMLQFFNSVRRILKPGGQFFIQILNYDYILKNEITALPLIENDRIKFIRNYTFISDQRIQFNTQLEIKASKTRIDNSVELYPLSKNHLEQLLVSAGFRSIRFRSNFKDEAYSPNSLPLIVKAQKG